MADRAQVLISQAFKKAPKFICDECGFSTNIKSRLVDHVNSVHLKINNESGNESEDTSPRPQTRREVLGNAENSSGTQLQSPNSGLSDASLENDLGRGRGRGCKSKRKAETALSPCTPKRKKTSCEKD